MNETALEEARHSSGHFIIATNDLDASRLPAQAMLENYKDQGGFGGKGLSFPERSALLCS